MCDVCLKDPCDIRCPNRKDIVVGKCTCCGQTLFDSSEVWSDTYGAYFCSRGCADRFYGIEEVNTDERPVLRDM